MRNRFRFVFSASLFPMALFATKLEKPNILFILADDLGYGDLACYGNKIIKTPHIDRLANEGVAFTNCYAGASVSSPSRCCLMTGLHSGHARIRGNMCRTGGIEGTREGMQGTVRRINLLPQDSTIAHLLSRNGYTTCLVNKWHLDGFDPGAGPLDRGFDEFYGWLIHEPQSHNYYPSVRWKNREAYMIEDNLNDKQIDHNTDRSTLEAIDFIERNKHNPFFLYLAYNAPHVPLDAKSWGAYKNMDMSDNDKSYAALITHMDECIGKVVKTLERLDLMKNTIIVFASDNGGAKAAKTEKLNLNGGLRGWKGELYEGGIRVPMIIRMPEKRNAGKRSDFPCYFPDFMPTIKAWTGATGSLKSDGISLVEEVNTPNTSEHKQRYLYWEQYPRTGIAQAVRWGDWKLICQAGEKEPELYNLKEDMDESDNLAEQHPEIVRQMSRYMQAAHTPSPYWPVE